MTSNEPKADDIEAPAATAWTPPEGSWASSAANRKSMRGNKRRDTKPERALRSLLHAAGLRYRVDRAPLPDVRRRADIVFGPAHVAVFVDGCFWHGCPTHYRTPKTNDGYWAPKIARNIERDREIDTALADAGWLVLRFWEHQPTVDCATAVIEAVGARRTAAGAATRSLAARGPDSRPTGSVP